MDDYSPLIERIKQVFADVSYPGDKDILGTSEHRELCRECGELQAALVGKKWPELLEDESLDGYVSHAMSFFSAAAWHYYLPAYLTRRIEQCEFYPITFRSKLNPELVEYWEERINRLTPEQCRVIVAYHLVVLKENRSSRYEVEENKETVQHWKEYYQEVVSRNSDLHSRKP